LSACRLHAHTTIHTNMWHELRECLWARRFWATLLLHITCVRSWCNWRASCVAAKQTKNKFVQGHGWSGEGLKFEGGNLIHRNVVLVFCIFDVSRFEWESLAIIWGPEYFGETINSKTKWHKLSCGKRTSCLLHLVNAVSPLHSTAERIILAPSCVAQNIKNIYFMTHGCRVMASTTSLSRILPGTFTLEHANSARLSPLPVPCPCQRQ